MSALTNAILSQHPEICGRAANPLDMTTEVAPSFVVLHGYARRAGDVMLKPGDKMSAISRLTRLSNLAAVVVRWHDQGREITGVTPSDYQEA